MFMSKVKTLVMASALALPLVANAQPAAKDWEIILGGGGSANTEFRGDPVTGRPGGNFNATLFLGHYLTDNVEVGVRQTLGYASNGFWMGNTRAAVDYNFIFDKIVPFVGVNVGYSYANKGGPDSWQIAPEAGIKYYIQDKAFIFGMAEYGVPFKGRGPLDDGTWAFTLGIGLNL